jgi:hypothetical protein
MGSTPGTLDQVVNRERRKWAEVISNAKIKLD